MEVKLEQVNAGQVIAVEPTQKSLDGSQRGLGIAVVLLLATASSMRSILRIQPATALHRR